MAMSSTGIQEPSLQLTTSLSMPGNRHKVTKQVMLMEAMYGQTKRATSYLRQQPSGKELQGFRGGTCGVCGVVQGGDGISLSGKEVQRCGVCRRRDGDRGYCRSDAQTTGRLRATSTYAHQPSGKVEAEKVVGWDEVMVRCGCSCGVNDCVFIVQPTIATKVWGEWVQCGGGFGWLGQVKQSVME